MSTPDTELDRLFRGVRQGARLLALFGVFVLIVQAFSIVADALSRWAFNTPIHGLEDINNVLIAATISTFVPALFIERGNITVQLIGRFTNPRVSAWLDVFGHLLALVFIALLAWGYLGYAVDLGVTFTVILELPRRPTAMLAAIVLAASAVLQALVVIASFRIAMRGGEPREGSAGDGAVMEER